MNQTVIEVIGISRIGLEFDSSHRRPGRSDNAAISQSAEGPIIPAPNGGARGEDFDIEAVGDGGTLQASAIHENHNSHKRLARSIFIFMPPGGYCSSGFPEAACRMMASGKNSALKIIPGEVAGEKGSLENRGKY